MKKHFSYTLLIIYLFSALQLNEYLKIPILVDHFYEHQNENPKISLVEFLLEHYAHDDVLDADYDKDMKLPFKSHNHSSCACSNVTLCEQIYVYNFQNNNVISKFKKPNFRYTFSFISNFHSSIWQPPKIC